MFMYNHDMTKNALHGHHHYYGGRDKEDAYTLAVQQAFAQGKTPPSREEFMARFSSVNEGSKSPITIFQEKTLLQKIRPVARIVALALAYNRTKSIPKAIGAGIIPLIYLTYVGIQHVTKKK